MAHQPRDDAPPPVRRLHGHHGDRGQRQRTARHGHLGRENARRANDAAICHGGEVAVELEDLAPNLQVLGVVFTNVDSRATRLRTELERVVSASLPGRRFETSISQAVLLAELSGRGKTLFQLPRFAEIKIAQQYLRLAAEIEHRVRQRTRFLEGTLPPFGESAVSTPHPPEVPVVTAAPSPILGA